MHTDRPHGYTLIDLLIALTLVATLADIALPSFEVPLRKARRTDALVAVAQIQNAQERIRSRGTRYGSLDEIGLAPTSRSGHYALQITAFDSDGYTALATATGAQARDASCRYLSVRATGADLIYASGTDATLANTAAVNRQCWSL